MAGAPALACRAAHRAGAGLVTAAVPDDVRAILHTLSPETTSAGGDPEFARFTALAVGPGWGTDVLRARDARARRGRARARGVRRRRPESRRRGGASSPGRRVPTVLTPHPGEAGRLLGIPADDVNADREAAAVRIARAANAVVVLKGFRPGRRGPVGARRPRPRGQCRARFRRDGGRPHGSRRRSPRAGAFRVGRRVRGGVAARHRRRPPARVEGRGVRHGVRRRRGAPRSIPPRARGRRGMTLVPSASEEDTRRAGGRPRGALAPRRRRARRGRPRGRQDGLREGDRGGAGTRPGRGVLAELRPRARVRPSREARPCSCTRISTGCPPAAAPSRTSASTRAATRSSPSNGRARRSRASGVARDHRRRGPRRAITVAEPAAREQARVERPV